MSLYKYFYQRMEEANHYRYEQDGQNGTQFDAHDGGGVNLEAWDEIGGQPKQTGVDDTGKKTQGDNVYGESEKFEYWSNDGVEQGED